MKNFKFIISYDGSRYFGWERQPGRDTIQGKLEAVLTRMCGTDVQVIGAGRTDAGVHALGQVASVSLPSSFTINSSEAGSLPPPRNKSVSQLPMMLSCSFSYSICCFS